MLNLYLCFISMIVFICCIMNIFLLICLFVVVYILIFIVIVVVIVIVILIVTVIFMFIFVLVFILIFLFEFIFYVYVNRLLGGFVSGSTATLSHKIQEVEKFPVALAEGWLQDGHGGSAFLRDTRRDGGRGLGLRVRV